MVQYSLRLGSGGFDGRNVHDDWFGGSLSGSVRNVSVRIVIASMIALAALWVIWAVYVCIKYPHPMLVSWRGKPSSPDQILPGR